MPTSADARIPLSPWCITRDLAVSDRGITHKLIPPHVNLVILTIYNK